MRASKRNPSQESFVSVNPLGGIPASHELRCVTSTDHFTSAYRSGPPVFGNGGSVVAPSRCRSRVLRCSDAAPFQATAQTTGAVRERVAPRLLSYLCAT